MNLLWVSALLAGILTAESNSAETDRRVIRAKREAFLKKSEEQVDEYCRTGRWKQ